MDMITKLRNEIDKIDSEMITLIKRRLTIMKRIGTIKKLDGQVIRDPIREKNKIHTLEQVALKNLLPKSLITQIWNIFFTFSEEIEE